MPGVTKDAVAGFIVHDGADPGICVATYAANCVCFFGGIDAEFAFGGQGASLTVFGEDHVAQPRDSRVRTICAPRDYCTTDVERSSVHCAPPPRAHGAPAPASAGYTEIATPVAPLRQSRITREDAHGRGPWDSSGNASQPLPSPETPMGNTVGRTPAWHVLLPPAVVSQRSACTATVAALQELLCGRVNGAPAQPWHLADVANAAFARLRTPAARRRSACSSRYPRRCAPRRALASCVRAGRRAHVPRQLRRAAARAAFGGECGARAHRLGRWARCEHLHAQRALGPTSARSSAPPFGPPFIAMLLTPSPPPTTAARMNIARHSRVQTTATMRTRRPRSRARLHARHTGNARRLPSVGLCRTTPRRHHPARCPRIGSRGVGGNRRRGDVPQRLQRATPHHLSR